MFRVSILNTEVSYAQHFHLLFMALFLFPSLACGMEPESKAIGATVSIPAHTWKGIRLRGLPAGALLDLTISSDGEIALQLLDESGYKELPSSEPGLVSGRTKDTLSLSTHLPSGGDWYLVLDNRNGDRKRTIRVDFTATAPAATGKAPARSNGHNPVSLAEAFEKLEKALQGAFVIDELRIETANCGKGNAYAGQGRIILCAEYLQQLAADLDGDGKKVTDVLLYVLMHEAAHVLLDAWDLPLRGNEEAADELAVVLLAMFGQRKRIETVIDYFANQPTGLEFLYIKERDVRHPNAAQRARNLQRWLSDVELPRRWQVWLVPHMRTRMLKQLRAEPEFWTDVDKIEKELMERQ